jgi:hypothetical protein
MKNIKQLLEVRKTDSTSEKLGALIESGLLDQDKAFQVHRALTKENISPALLELVENLVIEALDKRNLTILPSTITEKKRMPRIHQRSSFSKEKPFESIRIIKESHYTIHNN